MINDGINNVPDKTIVIFQNPDSLPIKDRVDNLISKSERKRDWFTPHFYRCLPLSIGNQYGFVVKSEFDFSVEWDGSDAVDGIKIFVDNPEEDYTTLYPRIETHFGSGILTINPPFTLRTPPGINLMTINPPNHILHNITVMTGVVEADNIRRNFTFNLKLQMPNIRVFIPMGTPLAGFIPIPRYFADSFELKMADDIFSEDIILEEDQATSDSSIKRVEVEYQQPYQVGRDYYLGRDVYGNKFTDHQLP